jgi:hypothetical protein
MYKHADDDFNDGDTFAADGCPDTFHLLLLCGGLTERLLLGKNNAEECDDSVIATAITVRLFISSISVYHWHGAKK